jgi:hypothetical protein
VTVLCAFALLAIAGLAFDPPLASEPGDRVRGRPNWALLVGAATLLAASFAAYEVMTYRAALAQQPYPAWLRGAPLVPILETDRAAVHVPYNFSVFAEAFAIAQVALLAAVWYALRRARVTRALVAVLGSFALVSIGIAFVARGTTSGDLYAYAYDGAYGIEAYRSHLLSPNGPFAIVGHLYAFHMFPAAYGPVWLAIAHALVGGKSAADCIVIFRVLAALSLASVYGALLALRVPASFLGLVALDPALPYQYVADGHNDLFGVALLLWAHVAVKRDVPLAAVALAVLAGASKLSFLMLAPFAFATLPDLRRRVGWAALATVGSIVVSLALGGLAYPRALFEIATAIFPASGEPGGAVLPRVTTLAALALVAAAVIARRTGWPGAWGIVGLGSIPFPWYLSWALPYLVLDPRRATPFLVLLPLATFVLSTSFETTWAWIPIVFALPVAAATLAYVRWRNVWSDVVSARTCARTVPVLEGRLGGR